MTLTLAEQARARFSLQEWAIHRATDAELAAMADELSIECALLLGDLDASDLSLCDEVTLRSGVAFYDAQLELVAKQAERRLRARRHFERTGRDTDEDFRARFDAMRHADIVDAIQTLGVPLQKRGREWWGLCPFHDERTSSFAVNSAKAVWRCHGCQRGGDLVRFVMERQHLNAVEALRFLEEIIDVPGVAV